MINLAYWPPVKRMIKNQRSAPNRSVAGGYAVCSLDSSIIAVRTLQRLEADTGQNESGLPQTTTLRYRQLSGRDLICNSIEQEAGPRMQEQIRPTSLFETGFHLFLFPFQS